MKLIKLKRLRLDVDCGEKTCAKAPGEFCRFFGSRKFGSVPVCMLFPNPFPGHKDPHSATPLREVDGWTLRCQACLDAEEKGG